MSRCCGGGPNISSKGIWKTRLLETLGDFWFASWPLEWGYKCSLERGLKEQHDVLDWWSYNMFTFYTGKHPPEWASWEKQCLLFSQAIHETISSNRDFLEMNNVFYLDPFGGSLNLDGKHCLRWGHGHFARLFCENWVSSSKEWPLRTSQWGYLRMILHGPNRVFWIWILTVRGAFSSGNTVEGWKMLFFIYFRCESIVCSFHFAGT